MINMADLLEQAIRIKFPNIKWLEIHSFGRRKSTFVTFDKSNEHTQKEVEDFIGTMRKKFALIQQQSR